VSAGLLVQDVRDYIAGQQAILTAQGEALSSLAAALDREDETVSP
jgi:hypothetical protein